MKVKVHFRDGVTGGFLTTEHATSSYGIPVFVPDQETRPCLPGDVCGPADLYDRFPPATPFVPDELVTDEELKSMRDAGFRVEV